MKHWLLVGVLIIIGAVLLFRQSANRNTVPGVDINKLPPQYIPSTQPAGAATQPIRATHTIGVPVKSH